MVDPVITPILGCVILLACLASAWFRYTARRDGPNSLDWPSVPGKIVVSRTTEGTAHAGLAPSGVTTFSYTVDGKSYRGADVAFTASRYQKHEYAQRYKVGQEVQVYHKPGKPSRSVLIPGCENQFFQGDDNAGIFWFSQVAIIAAGLGIFIWAINAKPY
jgi:hypothetical protein